MAAAKTNSFYIRETIDVDAVTTLDNIDLSLYVDPVNKQALLVKNVDFIWALSTFLPPPAAIFQATCQLHDTTLGALREFDNSHVNDSMEIATSAVSPNALLQCTVVMECQVVRLSEKDYITLAMQQVADN